MQNKKTSEQSFLKGQPGTSSVMNNHSSKAGLVQVRCFLVFSLLFNSFSSSLLIRSIKLNIVPHGVDVKTWNVPIPSSVIDVHVELIKEDAHHYLQLEDDEQQFYVEFKMQHLDDVIWEDRRKVTGKPFSINIGTDQSFKKNFSLPFHMHAKLISQPIEASTTFMFEASYIKDKEYLHGPCADLLPEIQLRKDIIHPPVNIPHDLCSNFTLNGSIPVYRKYSDDTNLGQSYIARNREKIELLVNRSKHRYTWYYGDTDRYFYTALDAHSVVGKTILVLGSNIPWYEAILLSFGAKDIVTLDYNKLQWDHPEITTVTVTDWEKPGSIWLNRKFDIVISISALEHDGLGRYGDPIDPNADLKAMHKIKSKYLKRDNNSIVILSVPVGKDAVLFNMGRVYGKIRLPMLGRGFELINFYHIDERVMHHDHTIGISEPIMVLKPIWEEKDYLSGTLMVLPKEML